MKQTIAVVFVLTALAQVNCQESIHMNVKEAEAETTHAQHTTVAAETTAKVAEATHAHTTEAAETTAKVDQTTKVAQTTAAGETTAVGTTKEAAPRALDAESPTKAASSKTTTNKNLESIDKFRNPAGYSKRQSSAASSCSVSSVLLASVLLSVVVSF